MNALCNCTQANSRVSLLRYIAVFLPASLVLQDLRAMSEKGRLHSAEKQKLVQQRLRCKQRQQIPELLQLVLGEGMMRRRNTCETLLTRSSASLKHVAGLQTLWLNPSVD
jgi:hypothetical protein